MLHTVFKPVVRNIFSIFFPISYKGIIDKTLNKKTENAQDFKIHNLSISLKINKKLKEQNLIICGAEINFNDLISKKWIIRVLEYIEQTFGNDSQKFTFEININLRKGSIKGVLLLFKDTKSDTSIEEIESVLFQRLEKILSDMQELSRKISYKINTGNELTNVIFNLLKLKNENFRFVSGEKNYLKIINEKERLRYFTIFKKLNFKRLEDIPPIISKIFDLESIDGITFILSNKFKEHRKLFSNRGYMYLTTIVEGTISRKKQKEIGTAVEGVFIKTHIFDFVMRNLFFRSAKVDFEKGITVIVEAINNSLSRFGKNKEKIRERKDKQITYNLKNFVWIGHPSNELLEGEKEVKRVRLEELLCFNLSPAIVYSIFGALFEIPYNVVEIEKNRDILAKYFKTLKNVFFRSAELSRVRTEGGIYVLRKLLSNPNYLSEKDRIFIRGIIEKVNSSKAIIIRKKDDYLIYDISTFMKMKFDSYKQFMSVFNLLLIGVDYDVNKNFKDIEQLAEVYYVDRLSDISPRVLRYLLYSRNKKILTKKNKRNFEYLKKFVDFPILVDIKKSENRAQEYLIVGRKNDRTLSNHSVPKRVKEKRKYNDKQFNDKYEKHASPNKMFSIKQDIIKLEKSIVEFIQKNSVVSWEDIYNKFTGNLAIFERAIDLLTQNNTVHTTKVYFDDFSTTLFYSSDLYINPVEAYMMKKFSEICNEMGIIIDTSPYLKSVVVIEDYLVVFFMAGLERNSFLENLLFVRSNGYNNILVLTTSSSNNFTFQQINSISKGLNIELEVLPFNYQKIYSFLKRLINDKRTLQKV